MVCYFLTVVLYHYAIGSSSGDAEGCNDGQGGREQGIPH